MHVWFYANFHAGLHACAASLSWHKQFGVIRCVSCCMKGSSHHKQHAPWCRDGRRLPGQKHALQEHANCTRQNGTDARLYHTSTHPVVFRPPCSSTVKGACGPPHHFIEVLNATPRRLSQCHRLPRNSNYRSSNCNKRRQGVVLSMHRSA